MTLTATPSTSGGGKRVRKERGPRTQPEPRAAAPQEPPQHRSLGEQPGPPDHQALLQEPPAQEVRPQGGPGTEERGGEYQVQDYQDTPDAAGPMEVDGGPSEGEGAGRNGQQKQGTTPTTTTRRKKKTSGAPRALAPRGARRSRDEFPSRRTCPRPEGLTRGGSYPQTPIKPLPPPAGPTGHRGRAHGSAPAGPPPPAPALNAPADVPAGHHGRRGQHAGGTPGGRDPRPLHRRGDRRT